MLLAMADLISSGILSHGTSKVSCHLPDMSADWFILGEEQGDCEEPDRDEQLASEDDEKQDNGLESEDRLVCTESSGKIWRSSVTAVVSETHENKIYQYVHNICPKYIYIDIIYIRNCEYT